MMMLKKIFIIVLLLNNCIVFSQVTQILTTSDTVTIKEIAILPDNNYTIEQVAEDSSLNFIVNGTINTAKATTYWIKFEVNNTTSQSEIFDVWVFPVHDNTLYYLDATTKFWVSNTAGDTVKNRRKNNILLSCVFPAKRNLVVYVKCNVSSLKSFNQQIKPQVFLQKKTITNQKELFDWASWLVTTFILILFILYSTYCYFTFKEKSYLYYFFILLSGALYLTSFGNFFEVLLPIRIINLYLIPDGSMVFYFHISLFINRLATVGVIYSFTQLTRRYLNTKQYLPKVDVLFRIESILLTLLLIPSSMITFLGIAYIDHLIIVPSNLLILCIIITIFSACILSFQKNLKLAKYFLLANLLPLLLMFLLSVSLLIYNGSSKSWIRLLPNIAIISMALTFAVALFERIRFIKSELLNKETEKEDLIKQLYLFEQKQNELLAEKTEIISAIKHEKDINSFLKEKLEANQRELASNTMYIYQKKQVMSYLKSQMKELSVQLPESANKAKLNIESTIKNDVFAEADWEKFKLHFEQVHPNFFKELTQKFSGLTKSETRLCAYLYLKMTTKEIATLLNIDPASVRRAKTRLNKKTNGLLQSFMDGHVS